MNETVTMTHPTLPGVRKVVSRAAFDAVHADKGWVVDPGDPPAVPPVVEVTPLEAYDREGLRMIAEGRPGVEVKSSDTKPDLIEKIKASGYPDAAPPAPADGDQS